MRRAAPFGSFPCADPNPSATVWKLVWSVSHSIFRIFCDQELFAEAPSLDEILLQLDGHLMVHIGEHAPDFIFVHAGVVVWRGQALLFPGVSFAGKSTLVAELVRAGATYYSDEFALIDREGLVHPFPRELRMRRPDGSEQKAVSMGQLNGCIGNSPAPIALIAFTYFDVDGRWAPEPLTPGRAALELLLHTLPVRRTPARVLATFSTVMQRARALRSPRGEAAQAAIALLSTLDAEGNWSMRTEGLSTQGSEL